MRLNMQESLGTIGGHIKQEMIAQIAGDDEAMRKEMEEKYKDRSFFDKSRFKGSGMIRQ